MTGEMHESEVTREAYPVHYAIADAVRGIVMPFDQYQGPYILANETRLWLSSEDGILWCVYNENNERKSGPFFPDDIEAVKTAALLVTT